MTTWGALILIAAVFFGLKGSATSRPKYAAAIGVVFAAVIYAAMRQHAY